MRAQHFRGPAALPLTRNCGASIHIAFVLYLYFASVTSMLANFEELVLHPVRRARARLQ